MCVCVCVCVHMHASSVMSDSLPRHGLQPTRLLCPWDSPDRNTGVGCRVLLQGIFLTQGSNPCRLCLLDLQMDSLPLSHLRSQCLNERWMISRRNMEQVGRSPSLAPTWAADPAPLPFWPEQPCPGPTSSGWGTWGLGPLSPRGAPGGCQHSR